MLCDRHDPLNIGFFVAQEIPASSTFVSDLPKQCTATGFKDGSYVSSPPIEPCVGGVKDFGVLSVREKQVSFFFLRFSFIPPLYTSVSPLFGPL